MLEWLKKHGGFLFLIGLLLAVMASFALAGTIPEPQPTQLPLTWSNTETESPFMVIPLAGYINQTHIYAKFSLAVGGPGCADPSAEKVKILDKYNTIITGFTSITMNGTENKHLFNKVSKDWEYSLKKKDQLSCGQEYIVEMIATHNLTDISQPFNFGIGWGTNSTVVVAATYSLNDLGRHIVRSTGNTLYVVWKNATNTTVARSLDNGVTWSSWATIPPMAAPTTGCALAPNAAAQTSLALDSNNDVLVADYQCCASATTTSDRFRFVRINHTTGAILTNTSAKDYLENWGVAASCGAYVLGYADLSVLADDSMIYSLTHKQFNSGDYSTTSLFYKSTNNGATWAQVGGTVCSGVTSGGTACLPPRSATYGTNVSIVLANSSAAGYSLREYVTDFSTWTGATIITATTAGNLGYQVCASNSTMRHIIYNSNSTIGVNYTNSSAYTTRTNIMPTSLAYPTIACNGTDIYVMARNSSGSNYTINYVTSSTNGGSWGSETRLGTGTGYPAGMRRITTVSPLIFDYLYYDGSNLQYDWFGTSSGLFYPTVSTCNAAYNTVLTYNFKDEITEATAPANATLIYFPLSGQSFNFTGITSFKVCALNGTTFSTTVQVVYSNITSSVRSVITPFNENSSENLTLYLLAFTEGNYYTFTVLNNVAGPIPGATVTLYKYSVAQGKWIITAQGVTSISGDTTLFAQSFNPYYLGTEATGYVSLNQSYVPSAVTSITIYLYTSSQPANNTDFETIWGDTTYSITPPDYFHTNWTLASFTLASNASGTPITYYGMRIDYYNGSTTATVFNTNITTPSSGGTLSYNASANGTYYQQIWFQRGNYSVFQPMRNTFFIGNNTGLAGLSADLPAVISAWSFYCALLIIAMLAVGFFSRFMVYGAGLAGLAVLWVGTIWYPGGSLLCVASDWACISPLMATALASLMVIAALFYETTTG